MVIERLKCGRVMVYFFFSSRRRHTRWPRDWSSDVCSSDLHPDHRERDPLRRGREQQQRHHGHQPRCGQQRRMRSEERRVGKECSSRWPPETKKKSNKQSRGRRTKRHNKKKTKLTAHVIRQA